MRNKMNTKLSLALLGAVSLSALQISSLQARIEPVEEGLIGKAAGAAKSYVVAEVQAKGKQILETQADKIGKRAQNKFRQLLLKDASVRIVNDNGKEVGLHLEKANSEVLRNVVRKLSGIDLDQSIPGVPAPIAKFVLNKVENILLAHASEYIKEGAEQLTYNLAVRALGKAWNLADAQVESYTKPSTTVTKNSKLDLQKVSVASVKAENKDLEDHQVTALQGLVDHYSSKLKLAVNGMIDESVRDAVGSVAAQAYQSVEAQAEVAVRAAVFSPIAYNTPVLAPVAWMFDVFTPLKGSSFNQFVRWMLGSESSEAKLKSVAEAQASSLLNRFAPSWLAVTDQDMTNVYGAYSSRDAENGFTEVFQTEAPKTVSSYLSTFISNTKETVKDISNAATDFVDMMGPEGLSESEFQDKYDGQDPTNPFPTMISAGKSAASKVKSWFGW